MEFFKKVSVKHSDFVWIYLQSLCIDEQVYTSDDVRFPDIKVHYCLIAFSYRLIHDT